jgi:hypothetical protein
MPLSKPEGPKSEAEVSVRNLTRACAHSERVACKRSDPVLGGSLREFLDLRLALHERDKEILRLHVQSNEDLEALLALDEASLRHMREKTEAVDRALCVERALQAAQAEVAALRNELGNAHFHLTATRAELGALHAEFTTVQNELGEACLQMTAVRAELRAAQGELQCARGLGLGAGLGLEALRPETEAT